MHNVAVNLHLILILNRKELIKNNLIASIP